MNRELLLAALRVLVRECDGLRASQADVDLIRAATTPEESSLLLDEAASAIVRRLLSQTSHSLQHHIH